MMGEGIYQFSIILFRVSLIVHFKNFTNFGASFVKS
jgi:hypothetical protein